MKNRELLVACDYVHCMAESSRVQYVQGGEQLMDARTRVNHGLVQAAARRLANKNEERESHLAARRKLRL